MTQTTEFEKTVEFLQNMKRATAAEGLPVVIERPAVLVKSKIKSTSKTKPATAKTVNKFKATDLVLSLRSNSGDRESDRILDKATRGTSHHITAASSCSLRAGVVVCDAGMFYYPYTATQTQDKWTQINYKPVTGPLETPLFPCLGDELSGVSLSSVPPRNVFNTDKMEIPSSSSFPVASYLGSSPESNYSNVFRTEPPAGAIRPAPRRFGPHPTDKSSYACSEDGGSTSSASSFSTLPSSVSSPDCTKMVGIGRKSAFTATIDWNTQVNFGRRVGDF